MVDGFRGRDGNQRAVDLVGWTQPGVARGVDDGVGGGNADGAVGKAGGGPRELGQDGGALLEPAGLPAGAPGLLGEPPRHRRGPVGRHDVGPADRADGGRHPGGRQAFQPRQRAHAVTQCPVRQAGQGVVVHAQLVGELVDEQLQPPLVAFRSGGRRDTSGVIGDGRLPGHLRPPVTTPRYRPGRPIDVGAVPGADGETSIRTGVRSVRPSCPGRFAPVKHLPRISSTCGWTSRKTDVFACFCQCPQSSMYDHGTLMRSGRAKSGITVATAASNSEPGPWLRPGSTALPRGLLQVEVQRVTRGHVRPAARKALASSFTRWRTGPRRGRTGRGPSRSPAPAGRARRAGPARRSTGR